MGGGKGRRPGDFSSFYILEGGKGGKEKMISGNDPSSLLWGGKGGGGEGAANPLFSYFFKGGKEGEERGFIKILITN